MKDRLNLMRFGLFGLEHLPDAVYLITEDSRIVYVNAAATAQLGYSKDEFLQMGITELNNNMPVERWGVVWGFLKRTGGNSMEVEHVAKDGSLVPVKISASLLTFEGVDYSFAHVQNISTRRRLEQRLRQTDKMEALGQLAGGVAHDFNNQLVGVMGYAELLKDELRNDPVLTDYLDQILAAAGRSAALTKQLLVFSRQAPHVKEYLDVHDLVNEALGVLQHGLPSATVVRRSLQASPTILQGDASLLVNAFLNLALNARDAMAQDGGELVVGTRNVSLTQASCAQHGFKVSPGEYVCVSVSDQGVGMHSELASRVFEPFFTTKAPGEGTGLGLAAVYGTVMAHQGEITVDSEKGKGSVFSVYLPLRSGSKGASTASDTTRFDQEPHVLVLEDEEPVRRVAMLLLQSLGCRVTTFVSSVDGVAFFRTNSSDIDAVLLDMCMPEMDGSEAFRIMHALAPDVPVLLASGYTVQGQAKRLIEEGAKGFLQKPFRRSDLAAALFGVLANATP